MGLIGILFFLAGVHLLWQARREVLYWVQEFFRIWRGEFTRRGLGEIAPPLPAEPAAMPLRRKRNLGALVVLGAFALIVLGQVLFILDLAF